MGGARTTVLPPTLPGRVPCWHLTPGQAPAHSRVQSALRPRARQCPRGPCGRGGQQSSAARRRSPWSPLEAAEMWRREGATHSLPERVERSGELVLGSGRGEGLPGWSLSWGCRAYRTLPALVLSSVVTRADGPSGPQRGDSLGTKASGDSCSHVANAMLPSPGWASQVGKGSPYTYQERCD